MKRLEVRYAGWGADWPLGTLADDGRILLFEYASDATRQGLELSPLHLKLKGGAYGDFPDFQFRLPGLIADSLPDGWGLRLMDDLFRRHALPLPGPLERLALVGDRAIGALRYVPEDGSWGPEPDWTLLDVAGESRRAIAGEATAALRELALIGSHPQGAKPKALVWYDRSKGLISTRNDVGGDPWLVKFQAKSEHKEVCAIEHLYAALARKCGIDMPETEYFDLGPTLAAFGIARFDRIRGMRVPVHSLAGLLQIDFRIPGAVDYTGFLRVTRMLTRDEREVLKAYRRAVFNVVFHNRDDHAKNFAWRLDQDSRWRLAPGYDLTFSQGPLGEHSLDVCGKGKSITRTDLLQLANEAGISLSSAAEIIGTVADVAGDLPSMVDRYAIRRTTVNQVLSEVKLAASLQQ